MKRNIILLVFSFFAISYSSFPQTKLTAEDWLDDLEYLKNLIHEDYSHLFYKVNQTAFDEKVNILKNLIPSLESHEIIVEFAELIAIFGYGHSGVNLFGNRHGAPDNVSFRRIPVNFYSFSDGIFIQGVTKEFENAVGAEVLGIGEKSIHEALELIKPVVSLENEQYFKSYGIVLLSSPEILHAKKVIESKDNVPLLLRKDGKEFTVVMKAKENLQFPMKYGWIIPNENWVTFRNKDEDPLWMKNLNRKYYFEFIEEFKTVYVRQSQMRDEADEPVKEFYQRVFDFVEAHPVEKFILDLRLNDGGNSYKNRPIVLGLIKSKINKKGHLITIIGKQTYSAAQNLVNTLERYTETTFIGEPTSENVNFYGDVRVEKLPKSQLNIRLSYLWHQEGNAGDKRLATYPEITVGFTSEDYRLNQDPILQKALLYRSNINEAIDTIRNLTAGKQWDAAEDFAREFIRNPENRYTNLRSRINSLGYDYMNREQLANAIEVFKINTRLYPECQNCWDSLAESYWKSGQSDKAIFYYQKAIDLNPNGRTAENSRNMLRMIKAHR